MEENLVKKIFIEFLKRQYKEDFEKKVIISGKGEKGPDIITDRGIYEIEGSGFQKSHLFQQLISFLSNPQYSSVNVVLPCDTFDFKFIHQLQAIETFMRPHPNVERPIGIYLVMECASEEKGKKYAIYHFNYASSLAFDIGSILYESIPHYVNLPLREKKKKVLEFVKSKDFKKKFQIGLKNFIIKKAEEAEREQKIYEGGIFLIAN
jgi:hypothetical protein